MAIAAVLLDIEGVLVQEDRALPGAAEAVARLADRGLALAYLTNTTTRARAGIAERLAGMGFPVEPARLVTPAAAAARLLAERGVTRLHLAAPDPLAADFEGFERVETDPEAVVLGDLHRGFDWDRLNGLFEMVAGGAQLVALHKNRYCRRAGRLALDAGPFVAALEYAASVEAAVVGKPAPAFFESALAALGVGPERAAMVGDDIEADIGGALRAGLAAVQVRTGKYSERDEAPGRPVPTARIDTVADLPDWIAGG